MFNNTSVSADLDPDTYILVQRVLALKRIMAKFEHTGGIIKDIVGKANATLARDGSLGNPSGPVTLLMGNLHKYGAKLSNGLIITIDNEAPIDVINMPWQHVKKAVAEVVINNRRQASKGRISKA